MNPTLDNGPGHATPSQSGENIQNFVLFKADRIYAHRLMHFNYTTYDVRRAQDVVNPGTSHCNIMLLSNSASNEGEDTSTFHHHPFLYGRVIGIYHANIIYTGPGMVNYNPNRFDFLWVRWYEVIPNNAPLLDQPYHLDQLTFPPLADKGSFGFVDPADVLRSCHIIPAFREGSRGNGDGMSKHARDSEDWKTYYVGR